MTETDIKIRPMDCQSIADVCSLQQSTKTVGRWHMLIQHDGAVVFTEQRPGSPPIASITMPRRTFQNLINWYQEAQ